MTAVEPRPVDFHSVRRIQPPLLRAVQRWQTEACSLLSEAWSETATYPVRVSAGEVTPLRTDRALSQLPDPAAGAVLHWGPSRIPLLLAVSPSLQQAIYADLLGAAAVHETPAVVEPTPLEATLWELLLHRACQSLADGWPGLQPPACSLKESCRPRRTRRFTGYEEVLQGQWRVECRFLSGDLYWLAPRRELESLLAEFIDATPSDAGPQSLGPLAEQFPLALSVELGQAALNASALAQLRVGDVLILDQSWQRPLTARITGEPLWLVQPCRVGQRQAVQIDSLLEN